MNIFRRMAIAAVLTGLATCALSQESSPPPKLKDEYRMPWKRGEETYLRLWIVAGALRGGLTTDCFADSGGEARLRPTEGQVQKMPDGSTLQWHSEKSWSDEVGFSNLSGSRDSAVAYAFTRIPRPQAGKALLSVGSLNGIRAWVNGTLVLSRDGTRSCTPDEDQVQMSMSAGENDLLIKIPADGMFYARVLEQGSVFPRRQEISPSIIRTSQDGFTLKTDIHGERADADAVKVEVIRPGGTSVYGTMSLRGDTVDVDARDWEDGPYEVRCTTLTPRGLLVASHLPWYKGDFLPLARELAATAAKADALRPEGATLKMLADMIEDRLGCTLADVKGNPWQKVHSPLMEYREMVLEREGAPGRIRPYGFVRLAYIDDVDGSPQFCRAYLPAGYDPAKKWPLVIQLHGYNPANPVYVRWWAADVRHAGSDMEFPGQQGVIYVEPHGRGNTQYLGMGDKDILHVIAEAKRLFNVDEDRIYLTGDSMGGWGTWNVASRHPDLFAAIAPVFGGSDYHAQMAEEELAHLTSVERFFNEKSSSWGMADGLLNVPMFVRHGDADQSVNVEYSRWGVRLLQRWGYDVRYQEYPGRGHEALVYQNGTMNIEWFLQHHRNSTPDHVRIRSAELRNASAYWVRVLQAASPLAFMSLDAEIVERNLIRVDSDNILDIELSPPPKLVDLEKPVNVVWNGVPFAARLHDGTFTLTAKEYHPSTTHKSAQLPGTMTDFTTTPFAVVVGTVSKDTAMAAMCRAKASGFIDRWKTWQNQPPRVFADTSITEGDMAKYSLLLVGGTESNLVTAKFASRLPLQISSATITIDGTEFPAADAAVQMIYPNPLNRDRYVLVAAATSVDGMYFNELNPQRLSGWDYVITDGRVPTYHQKVSPGQMTLASGMFDYNWRFKTSLVQSGDSTVRANGLVRHRPVSGFVPDFKLLDAYVGRYSISHGPVVMITKNGNDLIANIQGAPGDGDKLLPESNASFSLPKYDLWLSFVRDKSGKVVGIVGFQEGVFEATKVE